MPSEAALHPSPGMIQILRNRLPRYDSLRSSGEEVDRMRTKDRTVDGLPMAENGTLQDCSPLNSESVVRFEQREL